MSAPAAAVPGRAVEGAMHVEERASVTGPELAERGAVGIGALRRVAACRSSRDYG